MLDIKIIGGTILDGETREGYAADLGIQGDKIVAIGNLADTPAGKTIDATGKMVCPGFIDMHTHSDLSLLTDSRACSRIHDGVTTDVVGNCGIGVAPVSENTRQLLIDYLGTRIAGSIPGKFELHWNTYQEYLDYIRSHPAAVNTVPLLAQGAIRIHEMGFAKGKATPEQIANMRREVAAALEAGAVGLSSGLIYLPGEYTDRDEMSQLCKELAIHGGFYVTHMRSEADKVFEAFDEALEVARRSGAPLHISHLKVTASHVGHADQLLERIEKARQEGVDVTFDLYPYTSGMTSLGALMPPWAFEGGVANMIQRLGQPELRQRIRHDMEFGLPGWQNFIPTMKNWGENVSVISVLAQGHRDWEGKTIAQIAQEMGTDLFEAVFTMLIASNSRIQIIIDSMDSGDVATILSHPDSMIGSDSMSLATDGLLGQVKAHPRAYGTHARVLEKYAKNEKRITFGEAVRKFTALPAKRLGLVKRGMLKEGYYADITIFDPQTIAEKATVANPQQYSQGFDTVIVNGQIAMEGGVQTAAIAGRLLSNREF